MRFCSTAAWVVLAFCLDLAGAEQLEKRYFHERCLPVARTFFSTQPTGIAPDFATNRIKQWNVDIPTPEAQRLQGRTKNIVSEMALDNGNITFDFVGRESTNYVVAFDNHVQTWNNNRASRQKRLEFAALPNKLNTNSALAMVRECFRRAGHNEKDFHPIIFEQIVVDNPPIALPLYRAEWRHRKVPLPDVKGAAYLNAVEILVSGVTSNLVEYRNLIPKHLTLPP